MVWMKNIALKFQTKYLFYYIFSNWLFDSLIYVVNKSVWILTNVLVTMLTLYLKTTWCVLESLPCHSFGNPYKQALAHRRAIYTYTLRNVSQPIDTMKITTKYLHIYEFQLRTVWQSLRLYLCLIDWQVDDLCVTWKHWPKNKAQT